MPPAFTPPWRGTFRSPRPGVGPAVGRRFLALAFQVQRQAGDAGPAGAQAVGAGRAIREHRARIGGQEAGAEWRGDTIADFGVQTAGWGCPVALGARPAVVCRDQRPSIPLDAAPQVGESVRERPWPFIPGASRTFALAPHSSYSLSSCATRPRTVPSTVRPRRGSAYCTRPPTSRPKPVSASPQSCRSPTSSVGVKVRPSAHVKPRLPSRTTRSRCASPSAPTLLFCR